MLILDISLQGLEVDIVRSTSKGLVGLQLVSIYYYKACKIGIVEIITHFLALLAGLEVVKVKDLSLLGLLDWRL